MPKRLKFQDVDNPVLLQQSLFLPPGVEANSGAFPPIENTYEGVERILGDCAEGLGLDLEFDSTTLKPSILGVANRRMAGAIPWDLELGARAVQVAKERGIEIVGHSVIGADRPVLEKALKIETPLEIWDDTMIRHYLCNPDLCKTPGKEEDKSDGGGAGAMGFMNLWCMASLHTDLPNWKVCRGKACEGPCPLHDPWSYCAIDSWAGLEAKFGTQAEMERKNIPEKLFKDLMQLSEITYLMETRGIKIDRGFVGEMERNFEEHKLEIFPLVDGVYPLFNPKSPVQIVEYFKRHDIYLGGTDKKLVKKALEKECKSRGYDFDNLKNLSNLPEEIDALYRLFEFKDSGKGLKSWFDDRYVDRYEFIHPRFIVTGTSMGRLASSGPNFQNIPARGFGANVRKAIIPRDPGLILIKADYSQLEFRKILHTAGYDLRRLTADPFAGLVVRSAGQLKEAANFMHGSERDVAKSIVHAYDLLEGFTVLNGRELERRKREIDAGALTVYKDWEYRGGVVAFTGGNLAERLFGNKEWGSRKKALAIQELMTAEFPEIRQFHRAVLREVEDRKGVQLPTGRFLPLYGSPEDDAKMAAAMHGQGGGAEHVIGMMLRYKKERNVVPILAVHDELVFELPKTNSRQQMQEFIRMMVEGTDRMPGFVCPIKAKIGENWKDMKEFPLEGD